MSRLYCLPVAALLILTTASMVVRTQTQFAASVDLVPMDVCVTDHSGRPAEVRADELMVFDNGTPQEIALFSPGDRLPLAVTLLVDGSRSMHGGLLDQARAGATALLDQLPDDSLVEVMTFNDHAEILYPMGTDRRAAALTLSQVSPIGGTSLYEAVLLAIRRQQHAERTRQGTYREVIVVLTDGEDTWGRVDFDVVLDEARRSSILVYPVVLPPHDAPASGTPWQMMQLALDTGGKTVAAHHPSDLTTIYQQIAADIRNLYRVGYVPSPLVRDGAWHQVQVRATRDDVAVRTRSGYYASSR